MKSSNKFIVEKLNKNIYMNERNPICIIKNKIFSYFNDFNKFENEDKVVSIYQNFDALLIPESHQSRKPSDTYYFDDNHVYRTHTTAHLAKLAKNNNNYLVCGDVFRRDEIDATHYPIFHQIDGFSISKYPEEDIRDKISGLIKDLFGNIKYTFLEDEEYKDVYFPFTINSFEVEIEFNGKKMELLGGGTVHPKIVENLNIQNGYAFGLGLERLAMAFFDIPDIRYFWTDDERFILQFDPNNITKFKPYSKYESCYKDIAFYLNDKFNFNDFNEIIRECDQNSIIEQVKLIDSFENKKINKISNCYRITYRSLNRTLTNKEVDEIQFKIREQLSKIVEIR